jgi:hypothetical protein
VERRPSISLDNEGHDVTTQPSVEKAAPTRIPPSGPETLTPGTATALKALGVCLIITWAAVVWFTLRPQEIVSDWNGGRQADTQTIAMNLTRDGASMLWPQVAWGGDGPGYVETEMQLYTRIIALFMGPFGPAAWIGQLISLLSILGTALVLWNHLGRRYGLTGALVGVLAFLAQRSSPHLATVVMPDALALFAYVAAWAAFHRYAEEGRLRDLVLFAVIGAISMVQKPTMAQLGVSSFVLLAMLSRARLKDYRVWVAWAAMVLVLGAYLVHAHNLYLQYGNTFGVLFGQDGKAPHLRHLFMPKVLLGAVLNAVRWGYGPVGVLALIALVILRRIEPEHVALAVGNLLVTIIALRYMSQDGGNYYFAPCNLLGCSAIASLTHQAARALSGRKKQLALAALAGALGVLLVRNLQLRHFHAHFVDPQVAALATTGKQLSRLTHPGDLVVVRSQHESYDVFWDWPTKQCEPRIFFVSGTHGWVLGRDDDDQLLATAVARGAHYFADPIPEENPKLRALLGSSGDLVWSDPAAGRIWRLHPPRAPGQ